MITSPTFMLWKIRVFRAFLALLGLGLVVFTVVFGRREVLRIWTLRRDIAKRQAQIEELSAVARKNWIQLGQDEKLRTEYREKRVRLEREKEEKISEIKELGRDEIVAELRRRGY